MKFSKKMVLGGGAMFAVVAIAAVMVSAFMPTADVAAARQEQCEGDYKVEGSSAYIVAPEGKGIEYVCIKAGNNLITFQCGDYGDECYHIDWIYDGCYYAAAVEVTKIGEGHGQYCQDISNVVAKFIECD
jgi:hypothetical protein